MDPRIESVADVDADARWQARTELARLEPGATADHPLVVSSSSLVELEATARPCLRCLARVRVEDHTVEQTATGLVRVAHIKCPQCTLRRLMYFRIAGPS
jgi:hypothetical protein